MDSSFFPVFVAAVIIFLILFRKFRFHQDNKNTNSSSQSLPSLPPSLSRNWKHPVFPSFHGPDVRRAFLSHILEVFRGKGIDPFIDNNIERSKSIGPELVEAIKGSKIAIVLLSKNYASSSWCLDELAEIIKCREELGQIVMTIFYEVDPTDIKKQTGDFGKAFKETCKGKTKEHAKKWRTALEDVATIAGEHSRNWSDEAAMIKKIATDVSNMLNISTPSRDFDNFVGMSAHMERMEQFLRPNLDEVRMIGIWGPPGIGKSTIARVLFNQVSNRYQLCAFMVNIKGCYPRPCLDEDNAQLQLQQQMLAQIINQKDIIISHLGVAQERLRDKKVFLVLDEVDQLGQLDALAKKKQWFGPGSRIIITTEDREVLKAHKVDHIYKVNFPSSDEAFQIFCMYAFGQKHPKNGFYELAWKVMAIAGKLPLGLKVLGSALRGKSKQDWKRALPSLKSRLNGEIESIIKFSYDALYAEDKYLFLYIACIIRYESVHKVEKILEKKFLDVRQGLHILAQKSLIFIDEDHISMHPLLRQFGREVSRKQFVHDGHMKRQLLVDVRDIHEVFSDDTTDSRHFIGIELPQLESMEELNISEKALERMSGLQFIYISTIGSNEAAMIENIATDVSNMLNSSTPSRDFDGLIGMRAHFERMIQLLRLDLDDEVKMIGIWGPPGIGKTTIARVLFNQFSSRFHRLGFLRLTVILVLNDIEQLDVVVKECQWFGPGSRIIITTENQRVLSARGITHIYKVNFPSGDEAFQIFCMHAFGQKYPDVGFRKLAWEVMALAGNLPLGLKILGSAMKGMSKQEWKRTLPRLKTRLDGEIESIIKFSYDALCDEDKDLFLYIACLFNYRSAHEVEEVLAYKFSNVRQGLHVLAEKSLIFIDNDCIEMHTLLEQFGGETSREQLVHHGIRQCQLLVNERDLREVLSDNTTDSRRFIGISLDLSNDEDLSISEKALERMSDLQFVKINGKDHPKRLQSLLYHSQKIRSLHWLGFQNICLHPSFNPEFLVHLVMRHSKLHKLWEGTKQLKNLRWMDMRYSTDLKELPDLSTATNLEELDISGCSSLVKLPDSIGTATNLKKLDFSGCSSLMELPNSFGKLTNLAKLHIMECSSLVKLPDSIGDITNLKKLELFNCSSLVELPSSIGKLINLQELIISKCSSLVTLPDSIGDITTLTDLYILNCPSIVELPSSIRNLPPTVMVLPFSIRNRQYNST